jgi:hypothetical protein
VPEEKPNQSHREIASIIFNFYYRIIIANTDTIQQWFGLVPLNFFQPPMLFDF